ncbi:TIGR02594 family protein [Sesbania bispinosa]|nr:TIGR02594 family protein [Sesbania bispinosa]
MKEGSGHGVNSHGWWSFSVVGEAHEMMTVLAAMVATRGTHQAVRQPRWWLNWNSAGIAMAVTVCGD